MAYDSDAIQSRLIRDLEPVVEVELNRHLGVQKNWYPHEYVPWSEGRDYAGPLNGDAWEAKDSRLTPVAQDSLVLNLLTEDNLPSYHTEIALSMGRDGAWGNWIERWTAEEARHAIVIRDYLMATRGVDPYELKIFAWHICRWGTRHRTRTICCTRLHTFHSKNLPLASLTATQANFQMIRSLKI